MPRKRAVKVGSVPDGGGVTVTVTPETEPHPEIPSDEQKAADAELATLETENPRGSHVVLWRVHRMTGQKSRLGKFTTNIVDGDWVADQFGGGKFTGQKFRPKKSGGFEYAGVIEFDIDEALFPPKVPSWAPGAAKPATGPVSNGDGTAAGVRVGGADLIEAGILQLFQASQGMQQMQTQMMMAFIEKMSHTPERKETDLMPLIVALIEKRKDPMEIARELFETTSKANARAPEPPSAMVDALALMDRFEARARRNAGAAADPADDTWLGYLKTATPEVVGLFKEFLSTRADLARRGIDPATGLPVNGAGAVAGAPAAPPSLPPPAPAPTAYMPPEAVAAAAGVTPSVVVSGPVTDPSMPFWAPFLKPFVAEFLDYAKRGKDPKACADLLLTRLELNDQLELAAPLIDDSTFGAQFVKAFPEFQPYAVWVEMMLQAGREDLSQSDDGESDTE
jgi:hypothetical protein